MALHFQRLLQTQLNDEDALTVLAPGLGLRFLLADLLRRYCDPAHFVVVVNATAEEEDFLVRHLALEDVQPLPLVINNEVAVADRSETTREQNGRAPARASRADLEHGALATARAAPPPPPPVYANGGVVFVTSRILVVDMLTNRFPTSSLTGLIVCHAERYEREVAPSPLRRPCALPTPAAVGPGRRPWGLRASALVRAA